tara:strand:+ start:6638 stop:6931 length:294 start_codon:yes stop_codon:yes gene_type:complete
MFELDLSLRPEFYASRNEIVLLDNKRKLESTCEYDSTKRREITDEKICAVHALADSNLDTKTSLKHPHAGVLREYGGIKRYISTVMSGRVAESVEDF